MPNTELAALGHILQDTRDRILEIAAQACEKKVMRPAGHNGQWEGYGPLADFMTGEECAAKLRSMIGKPL